MEYIALTNVYNGTVVIKRFKNVDPFRTAQTLRRRFGRYNATYRTKHITKEQYVKLKALERSEGLTLEKFNDVMQINNARVFEQEIRNTPTPIYGWRELPQPEYVVPSWLSNATMANYTIALGDSQATNG